MQWRISNRFYSEVFTSRYVNDMDLQLKDKAGEMWTVITLMIEQYVAL